MGRNKPVVWLAAMVGLRVRTARKEKGLTMGQLGELVGVTAQAVSQWEMGAHAISQASLVKVAMVTGKPLHWFYRPVPVCPECGQLLPIDPSVDGVMDG